jgi:hypothetical protein
VAPWSKKESGVRLITAMMPNDPGGHSRLPRRSVLGVTAGPPGGSMVIGSRIGGGGGQPTVV